MSTITEIEDAFAAFLSSTFPQPGGRDIVAGLIGEGPAPSRAAVIWRTDSWEPDEFPRTEYVGDDQVIHAVTPVTFVVTCLGDRPGQSVRDDCLRIQAALRLSQRTGDLFKVCGFWSAEEVRNLTALETDKMRQRAEFRVVLSADLTLTAPREVIDEVALTVATLAPPSDRTINVQGPA